MPSKVKPRLSRGVLDMKFMQRTKKKVEKEADDEQSRALYSNEINEKMINSSSNFIVESSYSICEGLIDGRLSFRGMNPEIELLMEQELAEKRAHSKPEQPKEVSDKDMAKAYYANKAPTVTNSMAKKFSSKKNFKRKQHGDDQARSPGYHPKTKQQFKKPREDDD
ncbi:M-phase phosphoprotein 6 [Drosophila kikkawai]|uniref:M-phase phosphoprotein 6 n=1 Tax=Drosophila kikkawai TaxID=30033 RepID=A0A6P4IT58_DROKI|nr:M-phase phosphoprotein 6 [Drosophila kikkawai]